MLWPIFDRLLYISDPIPAPHDVRYNVSDGILHWSPPHIEEIYYIPGNGKVSIDLRITHYIIHVTDQRTGLLMMNFSTSGPETNTAILESMPDVPCSMLIQVSAVNPAGEGQRSTSITENRKSVIRCI